MDWNEFAQSFIARVTTALTAMRTNLVAAGVNAGNITVEEVNQEGVNDLRLRLTATRQGRTFTAYLELTAAGVVDGMMAVVVTLYTEGPAGQITTSYTAGVPVQFTNVAHLLDKLTECEGVVAGELLTAARAVLRV